ncbi:Zinc finger C2H2 [Penicillium cf. griseofulvum]|uniref:Zinc finger C2H2 n=1 Tax=Penicillium cf. griseofulvum TaxID=2972120 RepID=A0A9W9T689_9EURO|nr:Zinc finger C2H2 [Penicillium cf. griseofulvum]KAJ5422473.1 Zinc finger C2H2 [Penicillium cf. griseofulvum]
MSTNLFQCGTCSQSFTRIDHLGRHVRSHTRERPYRCSVCNKRFGRADLLSRHSALHDPHRETASTKRRRTEGNSVPIRASQACKACAENHLRCNDEKPCRRCQRKGIRCSLPTRSVEGTPPTPMTRLEVNTSGNDGNSQMSSFQQPQKPQSQQPRVAGSHYSSSGFSNQIESVDPGNLAQLAAGPPIHVEADLGRSDEFLGAYSAVLPPTQEGSLPDLPPLNRGGLVAFGLETNLDLSMVDLSFLESYNARAPFEYEAATASTLAPTAQAVENEASEVDHAAGDDRSVQRLRWRFVPVPQDHGYAEHGNLLLSGQAGPDTPLKSLRNLEMGPGPDNCLDLASRDKILSIVLSQMPQPFSLNAASFPSPELLDRLIRYFFTVPFSSASAWIHRSTLIPKQARSELLLAMAAAGAILTPDSALQKLGFAMQEVVRHRLSTVFESDNTLIRDLELHQAFLLCLENSLWSANSRKMEISESFRYPLITMLRRRGRFDAAGYPTITVNPVDTGKALEDKWRFWVREESIKRLVYHLWQHDAQCSMVLLTSPLMSYAELSISLPACSDLWNAPDAKQWKELFRAQQTGQSFPTPTPLTECVLNMDLLESHRHVIDMKLSCSAVLHAIWGLIWEYRQMSLLTRSSRSSHGNTVLAPSRSWSGDLLLASRYQHLTEMLNYFGIGYKNENALYWHTTLMHMHMSLEEIQLLAATLEQSELADRIPPIIEAWSASKEGRQAVWHSAQVIRELRALAPQCLRDFTAVALYHSTLALWAYGMGVASITDAATAQVSVWLDTPETEHVQRFISFGRGQPMLHGESPEVNAVDLSDPTTILALALRLMHHNHSGPDAREPPLVKNIAHTVQKLLEVTAWSQRNH